jgi:NAD-dependent deacetylase
VVLSGSGVSAESGVPTFRASDGLWEGHRIQDVATPEGFEQDPDLVWRFYNGRRVNIQQVRPNPGHFALAQLERRYGPGFLIATQNVDGLHQQAGSQNVLELHGCLRQTRCLGCQQVREAGYDDLGPAPRCEHCQDRLRPNIVWFGEPLPPAAWRTAELAARQCDVFLVVGTSAVVYPAAGLVRIARDSATSGRPAPRIAEFNLTRTDASEIVDDLILGPSGQTLPRLLELLKAAS